MGLEFINMMAASGRLEEAARILGYLDSTGMLAVDGPGFRQLVVDASKKVDDDPVAAKTRRSVAADMDDEWALRTIRETLADLLDSDSTAAPPATN